MTAEATKTSVTLRIADTGIGIAANMLPLVFEPFVQEKQALNRPRGGPAATGIPGLPFDGSACNEVFAIVSNVFLGDTLRNRLRAFKLSTSIEVTTILARS